MKGLRGHSKPKALMFLFATPERENKGTMLNARTLFFQFQFTMRDALVVGSLACYPRVPSPELHGRAPSGGDALREEALSNSRKEECILPLLHVENIPGYSEEQQAAGYRAALLRSSTWGLCWQCLASP